MSAHLGVTPRQRLYYLDNLRTVAMLLGVLVHTATLADFGFFEYFGSISDRFRMATFFLVSGFFATLLLERFSLRGFMRHRIISLLVPLAAGLIIINPITLWLVFKHHNPSLDLDFTQVINASFSKPENISGPLFWHLHLWFLFSLIAFALSAPFMYRIMCLSRLQSNIDRIIDIFPPILIPLLVALAISSSVLITRVFVVIFIRPMADVWLIQVTFDYWPYFLIGMFLFIRPREWNAIHRIDYITIFVAALFYFVARQKAFFMFDEQIGEAVSIFSRAMVRCAVIFSLLYLFRYFFDKFTGISSFLSRSIYTVYIFHFLSIYMISKYIPWIENGSQIQFVLVAGLSYALLFSVHKWLIEPFWLLRLLFNGRLPKDATVNAFKAS